LPVVDFNALIDEHGPMVFRISWRILGHASDVEDNVQEAFFQAYRLGESQKINHWRGLLRRLATVGALAKLRRRRPAASLDDVAIEAGGDSPEEELIGRELETRLRQAVAELPQREGEVFSLRYFEGLELDEIAATLSVKYSAAAAALSRARARLRKLFDGSLLEKD
jgi:RNA polymerase sigma-70 factor (ECF subfamily)